MAPDSHRERRVVTDLLASRTAMAELVLIAVGLALGINLASSSLAQWLPPWATLIAGLVLVLVSLLLTLRRHLMPRVQRSTMDGFLIADRVSGELISVPTYTFSERIVDYLQSALTEDAELATLWRGDPPLLDLDDDLDGGHLTAGDEILIELVEYGLLAELSTSLTDYFQHLEAGEAELVEYTREDLPPGLIQNRFLELFSRDHETRDGFEFLKDYPEDVSVVSATSDAGAYYDRFSLILPKKSKVERERGRILITGDFIDVTLTYSVLTSSGSQPLNLVEMYTGRKYYVTADFGVDVSIDTVVRRKLFFRRRSLDYDAWVEYFEAQLRRFMDTAAFLERIQWPVLEASLQIFRREQWGYRSRGSDPLS